MVFWDLVMSADDVTVYMHLVSVSISQTQSCRCVAARGQCLACGSALESLIFHFSTVPTAFYSC